MSHVQRWSDHKKDSKVSMQPPQESIEGPYTREHYVSRSKRHEWRTVHSEFEVNENMDVEDLEGIWDGVPVGNSILEEIEF